MTISVLGICGSPRKGATEQALRIALENIQNDNINVKQINLREYKIHPCKHCDRCIKEDTGRCMLFQDDGEELLGFWEAAHVYLIATPVYSMGITPELSTLISRMRPLRNVQTKFSSIQRPKVGSCITVGGTRHGGQETAAAIVNNFYLSRGILVSGGGGAYNGGTIWSKDLGAKQVYEDQEGLRTIDIISTRLVSAATLLYDGSQLRASHK